jgi:beta-glucosidase
MRKKYREIAKEDYTLYVNEGGPVLGTADESRILVVDGGAFKDLNRNGKLDPYEDWRLPLEGGTTAATTRVATLLKGELTAFMAGNTRLPLGEDPRGMRKTALI